MNIKLQKTGDLTATLKIELTPADYVENVNKVLKDYQRKAQMPGFRPGKVPFSLTKKMYGQAATADEINKLLGETLDNYIKDNNLQLLGNPLANVEQSSMVDYNESTDMSFAFDMAFSPSFDLKLSPELGVKYYNVEVSDKMAIDYLEDIRRRQGQKVEVEAIEKGDLISGNFVELNEDSSVKEDGLKSTGSINTGTIINEETLSSVLAATKGSTIVIDLNQIVADDNEKSTVLGVSPEAAETAGSLYNFTIESVSRMMPAELDEDFFEKVFPGENIKTEEEMLIRIKKEANQSFTVETDRKFFNDAIEALIESAGIPLPDEFVKRWLVETNPDKLTVEDVERDYEGYARSLRWQLIENRIVTEHHVHVSEEEVKDVFRGYFRRPGMEELDEDMKNRIESLVDSFMKNKEEAGRIRNTIFERKMIEFTKEKLQPQTENLSYEEFVKLASTN